jgi:site-specific DNA-methyltransferase (adenine-specific)
VKFVKASIEQFGFKVPIIIDSNRVIVCGHTRLMAAKSLGMSEVPCIMADDLTDDQIRAFRLADNKVGEFAEWDMDLLGEELGELAEISDIDMGDFGFDLSEFDNIGMDEKTEVEEDEVPEEVEPVCQRGEIWQLGEHRLMCGDSTSEEDVNALMVGGLADMVFTDPPYGIDYSGGRTQVVNKKEYGKLKNDDLQGEELGNLICNVFKFNKSGADVYICVSPIMQKPFLDQLENMGKKTDAVIVWDKTQPGLGYMAYRRQCKFILFVKGSEFHKGDKTDIDLWRIGRDDAKTYVHGTQKPVGVSGRAIKNSSKADDIVLDLFGGSGSTLIACEQLNRKCRMMELDPHYCDVIIARWEKLTGKKAVKL